LFQRGASDVKNPCVKHFKIVLRMLLFVEVAATVPEHLGEKVIIKCILLYMHFVGVLKT